MSSIGEAYIRILPDTEAFRLWADGKIKEAILATINQPCDEPRDET